MSLTTCMYSSHWLLSAQWYEIVVVAVCDQLSREVKSGKIRFFEITFTVRDLADNTEVRCLKRTQYPRVRVAICL